VGNDITVLDGDGICEGDGDPIGMEIGVGERDGVRVGVGVNNEEDTLLGVNGVNMGVENGVNVGDAILLTGVGNGGGLIFLRLDNR